MIRAVTYNLSGASDAAGIVEVLSELDADIVCALETPGRFPLRRMARRAGLDVAAAAGRRRAGVAVLTGRRVRVVSADTHELPRVAGVPRRHLAQAILSAEGLRLVAVALQLGLRPDVRERHVGAAEDLIAKVQAPPLLGADLNEAPGGPIAGRLAASLQDAFAIAGVGDGDTYPNPEPVARKSFMYVAPSVTVIRAWVPDQGPAVTASHHRPVVVELSEPLGEAADPDREREDLEDEESAA